MSKYPEIQKYLKNIERELGDVDQTLKDSIIQEIREHLDEKIEDFKRSANVKKLSLKKIKKVLEEFGEPEEIALEYRRQFSEEQIPNHSKKSSKRSLILSVLTICTVILLITAGLVFFGVFNEENGNDIDDNTIHPGKGLKSIQVGDDLEKVIDIYGNPEEREETINTIWVVYHKKNGIDFLLNKQTSKILEIRFNPGFDGALENSISFESSLEEVLNKSGGALKTVQTSYGFPQPLTPDVDRVLFEQLAAGGKVMAYEFIDAREGILFWFDSDKNVTQIVVFEPFEPYEPYEPLMDAPWLQALAWKPNGTYCLVAGSGMPLIKFDGVGNELIDSPEFVNFYDIAWHPEGEYALICGTNGSIYKYNGTNLIDLSLEISDTFTAIKFAPNGQYAITVGLNCAVGLITDNQSHYSYIPDNVVVDIDLQDLAWNDNGSQALLVGFEHWNFSKGMMLTFTPGKDNILNASYSILETPPELSTCFSIRWVEEWQSFIVTANLGQVYQIGYNWSIDRIPNPFFGLDPIIDSMWLPDEKKILLVGGIASWDSEINEYDLERSTRVVLSSDRHNLSMIDQSSGPPFLTCGWDPRDNSAILIGAFGIAFRYKQGKLTKIYIDIDKN